MIILLFGNPSLGNIPQSSQFVFESRTTQHYYNDNKHATNYDADRNVTQQINANGNTSAYNYTDRNELRQILTPLVAITQFNYDAVGNPIQDDKADNLTTQIDAAFNETRFAYDLLNRRTAITYPDTQTLISTYNSNSNLLTLLDPRGITTNFSYDALNRQTHRSFTTPDDASINRYINSVAARYDGNNNPILSRESYRDPHWATTQLIIGWFKLKHLMSKPLLQYRSIT